MKIRILLFDDITENRKQVRDSITMALKQRGEVLEFAPKVGGIDTGTYESRLTKDLQTPPNNSIDLIVADRDLSCSEYYPGLSENAVRLVANSLGIPECAYARGEGNDVEEFFRRGKQSEGCIRLSFKPKMEYFAQRVVAIADGFLAITEKLISLKGGGRQTPGKLLAAILGKPEYADKISLYASGDQNRLQNVLQARGGDQEYLKQLTCLFGYWLWDSVLRFPGVTVGIIPASSYLNIRQDIFWDNQDIQKFFSKARYEGPFAAAKVPMWWRGMLDDMVTESGCADGREYASKILGKDIPPSECCDEKSMPAGYYCMLKQLPVSLKNSKGGLPWFPRGADLARVSNAAYEELGPWL